jgi:hypothetical protein
MAKLYPGYAFLGSPFNFNANAPVDDRLVVDERSDLDTITKYVGMLVYVKNEELFVTAPFFAIRFSQTPRTGDSL